MWVGRVCNAEKSPTDGRTSHGDAQQATRKGNIRSTAAGQATMDQNEIKKLAFKSVPLYHVRPQIYFNLRLCHPQNALLETVARGVRESDGSHGYKP